MCGSGLSISVLHRGKTSSRLVAKETETQVLFFFSRRHWESVICLPSTSNSELVNCFPVHGIVSFGDFALRTLVVATSYFRYWSLCPSERRSLTFTRPFHPHNFLAMAEELLWFVENPINIRSEALRPDRPTSTTTFSHFKSALNAPSCCLVIGWSAAGPNKHRSSSISFSSSVNRCLSLAACCKSRTTVSDEAILEQSHQDQVWTVCCYKWFNQWWERSQILINLVGQLKTPSFSTIAPTRLNNMIWQEQEAKSSVLSCLWPFQIQRQEISFSVRQLFKKPERCGRNGSAASLATIINFTECVCASVCGAARQMKVFHSSPCVFSIRFAESRLVLPSLVEQCGTCGSGKAETYRSDRQTGRKATPDGPQPCTCCACQSTPSLISAVHVTALLLTVSVHQFCWLVF